MIDKNNDGMLQTDDLVALYAEDLGNGKRKHTLVLKINKRDLVANTLPQFPLTTVQTINVKMSFIMRNRCYCIHHPF